MEQKWKSSVPPLVMELRQHHLLRRRRRKKNPGGNPLRAYCFPRAAAAASALGWIQRKEKEDKKYINLRMKMQIGARCKTRIPGRTWRGSRTQKEQEEEGEGFFSFLFFFFLSVAQPDQKTHTCQSERWCSTAAPLSGIEMQSNKWRSSDARTHEATSRVLLSTALRLRHQQDDWIWQIFRTVAITLKVVAFFNGMGFLFLFLASFLLRLFLERGPPMCRVWPHQRVAVFSKAIVRATFCPSVLPKGGLPPLSPGLQKDAETSHDISR